MKRSTLSLVIAGAVALSATNVSASSNYGYGTINEPSTQGQTVSLKDGYTSVYKVSQDNERDAHDTRLFSALKASANNLASTVSAQAWNGESQTRDAKGSVFAQAEPDAIPVIQQQTPIMQKTPILAPQAIPQATPQITPPTPAYAGMTEPTVNPQPTQFTPMIMAKPDLETPITITTGETDAPKAIPTANESVTVKNDPVTIDTYQAQLDNEAEAIENNAAGIAANAQETARVNGEVVKQARSLAAVDQQVTAEIENNAAGIAANAQETARVNGEVVKQARSLAAVDQQIAAENEARRKTDATVAAHSAELADHESRIQTLESDTNSKFGALKNKVEENRQRASAGIAGVAAMANIPQVTNTQNFSVGAGVGNTDGESALAVGFSARATENVVVKSSVSNDTQHNFVVGAGVSYGW